MSGAEQDLGKWDYIYYAMWVGAAIGAIMWFTGWLGHRLGWFNDLGDLLLAGGRWVSLALAAGALIVGASRSQVRRTRDDLHDTRDAVHETRDAVYETRDAVYETRDAVQGNGSKLDVQSSKLEEQTVILREIRDRL